MEATVLNGNGIGMGHIIVTTIFLGSTKAGIIFYSQFIFGVYVYMTV